MYTFEVIFFFIYSFNIFIGKYSININILCFLFRYIVRFVDGKPPLLVLNITRLQDKQLLSGIVYQLSICYFLINNPKVHNFIYPLHRYYLQQFLDNLHIFPVPTTHPKQEQIKPIRVLKWW